MSDGARKLEGGIAIVTGTSPNIMGGIAVGLADEGAKVVSLDLNPEYATACARAIERAGGEALGVPCDVTKEDQVIAAVDQVKRRFGGVDILVNGAVLQIRKGLLDLPVADFRRQMDVILGGTFLMTKHVAESMIEQGRKGSIINIISTEGHQGNPGNIGYGTAKSGLLNFTRSAAMELAEFSIRVNSLTPTGTAPVEGRKRAAEWGVDWDQPGWGQMAGTPAEMATGIPLRAMPSPKHYARAAVFLASDDSEMITGFDLRVDAGTIARYWRWQPTATK